MLQALSGHQAAAEKALLHELRRQGVRSEAVAVDVIVRPEGLVVELDVVPSMSPTQAQRIATHVAQAVHRYDRGAPAVEISVHFLPPATPLAVSSN